ncbi:hypothetical protein [Vreelandella malpeensis]|uniref:Uncharacterized protein n=2 Tax=Halomonadaceae TaxID=28256 RepID=A0ABS8DR75_9GAMM|nr:hypothetical protein [Halomonas malpeensis]MCB8888821.1 hypothetical protein [Halomonas malpeensis]
MGDQRNKRFKALLLSVMMAFGALALAGCGNDDPPNPDAAPEEEQPMGTGPMSNDDAGETPSDDI